MCCPKKPKKSLDYIIKWVEDADKTFSNINASISGINAAISVLQGDVQALEEWKSTIDSTISDLVREAIEEYPWSTLPDEALSHKVDKVPGASYGSLAFFDGTGNITSSYYSTKQLVDISVNSGEVSSRNLKVNLPSPDTDVYGAISVKERNNENVDIVLSTGLKGAATPVLETAITHANMPNLQRALQDPDAEPTEDSDKLITSGGVKTALDEVVNKIHTLEYDDGSYESTIGVGKLNRDDDELDGAYIYGKDAIRLGVYGKRVFIDGDNIDNLNRALVTPSSTPEDDDTKLITSKAVYALKRQVDLMAQQIAILQNLSDGSKVLAFSIPKGERESLEVPAEFLWKGNYGISSGYSAALHFTLSAMCHYPVAPDEPARDPVQYDTTISIAAHGSILNFNAMYELEQEAQETFEYIDEVTMLVYLNSEALSDQQVFFIFTPVSNS